MTQAEFIYWLQGSLEYTNLDTLTDAQRLVLLKGIKEHLALQFNKVIGISKPLFDMSKFAATC